MKINDVDKKTNDFILFCLEIYKEKEKMTGEEVYKLFQEYKVFEYLKEGYDILHTQGDRWLMEDINSYLKLRGYEKM